MNPFNKNFNNPNSIDKNHHYYNSEQISNNIHMRHPQSKLSKYNNKFEDYSGYISNQSDLDFKNVLSGKSHKNSNKEDFYDYDYDLKNYSNQGVMDKNSAPKYRKNLTEREQNSRNLNPNIKKIRKNSDGELEIKLPFENFGAQKRSKIMENISYTTNPKNFSTPFSNTNEQNSEHKINYRLQKKIKKGEVDDEVEIINSYAKENVRYLPIEEYAKEFIFTLENSNIVIVMGETGSGKTTKIPEFLFKSGKYNIAHILPRKISAITVAQRVAKNMNFTLGRDVGYSVRFDYNYNEETKIKFLTEGMFIREILADPLLNLYNYIIVDDCHERTINSELIFGLLKKIIVKRPEIKIIISSATLDYDSYVKFFSQSISLTINTFVIHGRNYPVDIYFSDTPVKNYVQASISTALTIHKNYPINSGDILIFLTGQEEINNFIELCGGTELDKANVLILPLCSGLNIERQLEVFKPTPHGKRKIVLSTNIAEASVTIDNIAYVIDSCYVKMKFYNNKIDSDALYIIPASKFSLDQRAGRAGRTRPGKCFRLIKKDTYNDLYLMTNPELLRSNLLDFVLRIKSMGIKNLKRFETITKPDLNTIARALEILYFIGILDKSSNLTEIGIKACDIPIDPMLSVALISSALDKFKCSEELLIICSMLSIQNLFYQSTEPSLILKAKQKHGVIEGDHLTYLSIFRNWKNCKTSKSSFCKELHLNENSIKQAEEIYNNLKFYFKKFQLNIKSSLDEDGEDILKSMLKGFFLNIAQKQIDGSYKSLRSNINLHLHPTSVLYNIMPEFIFYSDVVTSTRNYIKDASKIEKSWIMEIANNYYIDKAQQVIREKHKIEVKNQIRIENESKKNKQENPGKGKELENSLLNNKFFFEKEKEKKKELNIDKEKILDFQNSNTNFKEEDKIFENDFNKMDERKKKFLTEDKDLKIIEEQKINRNNIINKYLKADIIEDDENNILNINPIHFSYNEKQFLKKNFGNKIQNCFDLELKEKQTTNVKDEEEFNYKELFEKNEIHEKKTQTSLLNRKIKSSVQDSYQNGVQENSIKNSDFHKSDDTKIKNSDIVTHSNLENSKNSQYEFDDEEDRIAMMRRKKNIKKPEKFNF